MKYNILKSYSGTVTNLTVYRKQNLVFRIPEQHVSWLVINSFHSSTIYYYLPTYPLILSHTLPSTPLLPTTTYLPANTFSYTSFNSSTTYLPTYLLANTFSYTSFHSSTIYYYLPTYTLILSHTLHSTPLLHTTTYLPPR